VQLIRCRCCSLVGLLRELQLFWGIPGPEHIGDVVAAVRGGCAQFRLQFLCQGLDLGDGWPLASLSSPLETWPRRSSLSQTAGHRDLRRVLKRYTRRCSQYESSKRRSAGQLAGVTMPYWWILR
jgi:hypothetical protein